MNKPFSNLFYDLCNLQHITGVMYGFRSKTELRLNTVKADLYREFSLLSTVRKQELKVGIWLVLFPFLIQVESQPMEWCYPQLIWIYTPLTVFKYFVTAMRKIS